MLFKLSGNMCAGQIWRALYLLILKCQSAFGNKRFPLSCNESAKRVKCLKLLTEKVLTNLNEAIYPNLIDLCDVLKTHLFIIFFQISKRTPLDLNIYHKLCLLCKWPLQSTKFKLFPNTVYTLDIHHQLRPKNDFWKDHNLSQQVGHFK